MAAGKSTCGALLAAKCGALFFDLDEEITAREGRSIAALFELEGEAQFRQKERAALLDLIERLELLDALTPQKAVIALGGGTVVNQDTRKQIRSFGLLCTLTAEPQTLAGRIAADAQVRPLAKELRHLLQERQRAYEDADGQWSTDDATPQEVADRIAQWWTPQITV